MGALARSFHRLATAPPSRDAFNNSAPDKGVGFNVNIPIGNKFAQSVQARSLMEYRQAELRLEQLYTQIRMQVVNQMFALATTAPRSKPPSPPATSTRRASKTNRRSSSSAPPPPPSFSPSSAAWPSPKTT